MKTLRHWSVQNARLLMLFYRPLERIWRFLGPVIRRLPLRRIAPPVILLEKEAKEFLFDCQMCGDCVLQHSGLSCPMNCPKQLRNGPCGGVRLDGTCEVKPDMPCVWVAAYEGDQALGAAVPLARTLGPRDHRRQGESAWLNLALRSDEANEGADHAV